MARIYHCNTVYNSDPPSDINPLILEVYKWKLKAVFCARDAQVTRIKKLCEEDELLRDTLFIYGWWEMKERDCLDKDGFLEPYFLNELRGIDLIVILDKDRIDPAFKGLMYTITKLC